MPRLESYEPSLESLLSRGGHPVELAWIRLATHVYSSSRPEHLAARYTSYAAALDAGPLDGLVLTGAPIEHLPLSQVRYWPELSELLDHARDQLGGTLGLCWGAMALAERLGLRREHYARKVFGLFDHGVSRQGAALLGLSGSTFACPQSRFAGFSFDEVARAEAEGQIVGVGASPEAGPTLICSVDGRVVMHLGHPEYEPRRLGDEWRRDRAAGRTDVDPPRNYDAERDLPASDWRDDSTRFVSAWLDGVARRSTASPARDRPPLGPSDVATPSAALLAR
jgi:homoserine O-succinyltransferase